MNELIAPLYYLFKTDPDVGVSGCCCSMITNLKSYTLNLIP